MLYLTRIQKLINAHLDKKLKLDERAPSDLNEAMRYAVLNGGKRLRAALIFATGEALGAKKDVLLEIAAAVEIIHAFSLIHDDLPALDNDALRRGKPTCHIVYGEAIAILAGDALHTYAFEIVASIPERILPSHLVLKMVQLLSKALGAQGLIGGEALDITLTNQNATCEVLDTMYRMKTGALIEVSILLGALAAGCENRKTLKNLSAFGQTIGLLFQIHDDIIGIESSTAKLGKTQGQDAKCNKSTYPQVLGMEGAKQQEHILYEQAMTFLKLCKMEQTALKTLTDFFMKRDY
jgi:geranylgeranyl pyrophosphate synthase